MSTVASNQPLTSLNKEWKHARARFHAQPYDFAWIQNCCPLKMCIDSSLYDLYRVNDWDPKKNKFKWISKHGFVTGKWNICEIWSDLIKNYSFTICHIHSEFSCLIVWNIFGRQISIKFNSPYGTKYDVWTVEC